MRLVVTALERWCRRVPRVFSALALFGALFASACEAQSVATDRRSILLSASEAYELQRRGVYEPRQRIEVAGAQYVVPDAPYVRLGRVGLDDDASWYQAWLEFRVDPVPDWAAGMSPAPSVTASVNFNAPGNPPFPETGPGWTKSDAGLPGLPEAEVWFEVSECEDDRPPPFSSSADILTIQAVWRTETWQLYLSCRTDMAPRPSGLLTIVCFGGSGMSESGVNLGLYANDVVDQGCRATLERLGASFAYFPQIVAGWRR